MAVPVAVHVTLSPTASDAIVQMVPNISSLTSAFDSGTLAQLAYAELLCCIQTPIVGEIVIALDPDAMPGQIVSVNDPRNIEFGTKSMRILEVRHVFALDGEVTQLTVTDDVTNSYPMKPADAYNAIVKASNPTLYQDRTRVDLASKGIDINIVILEKDYS